MPTYTVHAPSPREGETASGPERFVFVRDGFHFWAFLLAPLWLLLHGLWLALVIYAVGYGIVFGGLGFLHASANVQFLVGLLIALLIGAAVGVFVSALFACGFRMRDLRAH